VQSASSSGAVADDVSDWLTWQVVDSAFPTGMFAHSWGLESAWQQGEIADADALRMFLQESLLQAAFATLPFVNTVYESPDRLEAVDALADAFLTNAVANRASRIQGRTLVATVARVWPSPTMDSWQSTARATHAHLPPVAGGTFRLLGLPLPTAQRIVLFGTARGILSAAVRLGIVGSYEAQRLQHECAGSLEATAARAAALTLDDLAQTAPLIDLLQAGHDRLYSRLFQS
jgi:urease accessory protein